MANVLVVVVVPTRRAESWVPQWGKCQRLVAMRLVAMGLVAMGLVAMRLVAMRLAVAMIPH